MLLLRRNFFFICILAIIFLLTACAPTAQKELQKGKAAFIQQNYNLSFQHLKNSARIGNPDAQYALGYMYYYGKGVPVDYKQAKYWIRQAALRGHPLAVKAAHILNIDVATTKPVAKTKSVIAKPLLKKKVYTSTEKKLLAQNSRYYTIQVLGSFSKKKAISFIHKYDLVNKATYYRTSYNGKDWYVVICGIYPTVMAATKKLKLLSKNLQRNHPWIKTLAKVQSEISIS